MLADTLQDELLAIPGIAGAELEGSIDHPGGVRVQLAAGADPDSVGREVQRVLAAHGMRSQLSREVEPFLPPGSVVNLADYEEGSAELTEPTDELRPEPVPDLEAPPEEPAPDEKAEAEPTPVASERVSIAGVSVDDSPAGVEVTVRTSDGASVSRRAPATEAGLDLAAAAAAADAASPDSATRVVAVTNTTIDGYAVVNVMVEIADGSRVVGGAVITRSRAFGVASATWAALKP